MFYSGFVNNNVDFTMFDNAFTMFSTMRVYNNALIPEVNNPSFLGVAKPTFMAPPVRYH